IRRYNNYVVLQSISCSPECKIVGKILLDHPLSYALSTTVDVPVVYLQQFWKTVSKVLETKDNIKFKLDTQEIVYTVDMFQNTLKLPVETPDNLFIAPVNIDIIESFMHTKKDVIQYPCFTKLINANLMKKYTSVSSRLEEDYHFIKSTPRAHRTPTLTAVNPQGKKRKQSTEETSSPRISLKVFLKCVLQKKDVIT
nr:hypothetical protein [Tanacetum cinerariifolium]